MNSFDYGRVLNMSRYKYNNVIIIVNVIILEFLSARFIRPGDLLPIYHFLTRVRT